MAGDWIKVEHTTPDKPEVHAMAAELQITPEQVLGHLFRVWIWADQQSIDGDALSVTNVTLDRVSQRSGFGAAMQKVGWLTGQEGAYSLPNFDRHNGETSKKRALTSKRTKRWRDANNVTQSSPEKRREELNTLSGSTTPLPSTPENLNPQCRNTGKGGRPAKTGFPEGFAVSERVSSWAAERGFDRLAEHLEAFRGKCRANGYRYADWDAAFMEAIRADWAGLRGAKSPAGNEAVAAEFLADRGFAK